ncbi:hypothetical protein METSCH_G00240 [Metschnikowia aff. pulcherrima]|uniref:Uncharacterized protein n=1 Tax=Metschnikowia aff. pulcherrima TaxID=2163413 RepID=A0A4P6XXZ1_9ASCO|nr:hypothetical protein METSCH_G00240 [Metschnikowia aff. pulcherrima]
MKMSFEINSLRLKPSYYDYICQYIFSLLREFYTRHLSQTRPQTTIGLGCLDVGWVQHDSDGSTERLRRQVLLEVGSHDTVVAVGSGDLAPDDSHLGASDLSLTSVDVGNSLTKVELSLLWRLNTLKLDQGHVGVGDALGALVGNVLTLDVH